MRTDGAGVIFLMETMEGWLREGKEAWDGLNEVSLKSISCRIFHN